MLKGKLLLPLLGALLLVGCQTSPPKPEAQVVEKPRPVQRSLEQRWQDSANRKQELESLISRLQGAELRKHARKGAASPATLEKTLARLEQARRYTRQARDIVSALYGYRKAGGAAFETRWEQALWKRLGSSSKSADSTPSEVNELDLLAARRSLAAQIAKAWFYEKGVRQLRQRADEVRDLYQQVLDRHRTSKQLERGNHDGLLATRKELARVDGRARQLQRAERLAHKALVVLTGNKGIRVEQKASVKPVPGGLPMRLLANRPDVYRSAFALVEGGAVAAEPAQLLPELPLTSKGGRPTRTLSRWSRYKPEKLQEALNLPSGMETRSSTTHWCPGRPGHPAFRHNIASSLRLHTGLPYDWTPRSDAPLGSPLAPSARRVSRVASRLPGTTRLRFALHGGQRRTSNAHPEQMEPVQAGKTAGSAEPAFRHGSTRGRAGGLFGNPGARTQGGPGISACGPTAAGAALQPAECAAGGPSPGQQAACPVQCTSCRPHGYPEGTDRTGRDCGKARLCAEPGLRPASRLASLNGCG